MMDYDFSALTREQAAENIREVLELIKTTRREHALLDASLAMLEAPPVAVEEPPLA